MEKKQSHAVGLGAESPTSAQHKELWSQIESGRMTKRKMQQMLRMGERLCGYDLANAILAEFFISPEEITEHCGLNYSKEQLSVLICNFPHPEILGRCCDKKNHFMLNFTLLPGPPKPMSLIEIFRIYPDEFITEQFNQIIKEKQPFIYDEKINPGWIALRMFPCKENRHAPLQVTEELTTCVERAWAMIMLQKVRHNYLTDKLLLNTFGETSSIFSEGEHARLDKIVTVGREDQLGAISIRGSKGTQFAWPATKLVMA